jgi:hypothetical protein
MSQSIADALEMEKTFECKFREGPLQVLPNTLARHTYHMQ